MLAEFTALSNPVTLRTNTQLPCLRILGERTRTARLTTLFFAPSIYVDANDAADTLASKQSNTNAQLSNAVHVHLSRRTALHQAALHRAVLHRALLQAVHARLQLVP